jgi:hypothetical protein
MIYLARKENDGGTFSVIAHTDLAAMRQLDGIGRAEKIVSEAEWEEAGGLARIIGGKIFVGKTPEEREVEAALEAAETESANIKAEKLGKGIDELYPGESAWYKKQLERLAELEAVIDENKAA